jgi:hypothetical protein
MKITEIITEESQMPDSHINATPGMKNHPNLDNSSPYAPWRFSAHFLSGAGAPDGKYDFEPEKEGPTGQALVTVAYSEGEHQILDQAEKAFGVRSNRLTPNGSSENPEINNSSPVTARGPVTLRRK